MINAAGYKVWPAEVEMTLYTHPDVLEVAVVSAPDTRRGETVKAFVALKPQARGVSGEAIVEWARGRLAVYKVPRVVEIVDALPRSATGKIHWRALQEREWEGSDLDFLPPSTIVDTSEGLPSKSTFEDSNRNE